MEVKWGAVHTGAVPDPGRVEVRVLVAKVARARANGAYRLTVPAEIARELGLGDGDYVLVFLGRARWYHLIDWGGARDLLGELPEGARREISAVEAVREAGAIAAPGPAPADPAQAHLRSGGAAAGLLPGGGNI